MSDSLCLVVESGCDVRLADGLASRYELTLVGREIPGGRVISQNPTRDFELVLGPAGRVGFALAVLRHLAVERYDRVVVQGYGVSALIACIVLGWRGERPVLLICSPSEGYYRCRRNEDSSKPFRWTEYLGIMFVARLAAALRPRYVVLSKYLAGVVQGHGAVDVHRAPVYGVDLDVFRPADGSPSNPSLHKIFFSSRIAPEKDATTLIRALQMLRNRGREVRILNCSGGGGHEEFAIAASEFDVDDLIDARDAVPPYDQLAELYRSCSMCVQASRDEGLGFSVIEAMACGVPVIAADVGGLRETVIHGVTGLTYEAGSAPSLANAIEQVIADPDGATQRRENALHNVTQKFETNAVFDQFDAVTCP